MADELAAQTRITQAFINTRPVTLTLTPNERTPDGSGGSKLSALPPRTPQVFRFVEISTLRSDRRLTETGEQYEKTETLLGMPDAAIAVDDTFDWNGDTWRVEELAFPNDYEIRATVTRHGR